jgi:hypothetical protein
MNHARDVLYCNSCYKCFNTAANKGFCGYCKYTSGYIRPLGTIRCGCGHSTQDFKEGFPEYLKIKFVNGRLGPLDPAAYKRKVGLEIPADGPSDPAHYGHLLWHFYRFMKAVDKD